MGRQKVYLTCVVCGETKGMPDFPHVNRERPMCSLCKKRYPADRPRLELAYRLIYDPAGTLRKGATFKTTELRFMLRGDNACLYDGTRLITPRGRLVEISNGKLQEVRP